jgi:hypothetical protein
MIYTTCIMAYATFSYNRSTSIKTGAALGLISLAAWITHYYLNSMDPVFHQVAYGLLTCALVFRNMYVMEAHLRPALERRSGSAAHGDQILKQMWRFSLTGRHTIHSNVWPSTNTSSSRHQSLSPGICDMGCRQYVLQLSPNCSFRDPATLGCGARSSRMVARIYWIGSVLLAHLAHLVGALSVSTTIALFKMAIPFSLQTHQTLCFPFRCFKNVLRAFRQL